LLRASCRARLYDHSSSSPGSTATTAKPPSFSCPAFTRNHPSRSIDALSEHEASTHSLLSTTARRSSGNRRSDLRRGSRTSRSRVCSRRERDGARELFARCMGQASSAGSTSSPRNPHGCRDAEQPDRIRGCLVESADRFLRQHRTVRSHRRVERREQATRCNVVTAESFIRVRFAPDNGK
jgi:hypothetical protein